MNRTKANFRAIREIVGLSQADVADMAGVSVTAVKRWEHPDGHKPPSDVWEQLEGLLEAHRAYVEGVYDLVNQNAQSTHVTIPYYRSQAEYDELGRDPGNYSIVNARARAIWQMLDYDGMDVEFIAPDEMGPERQTRGIGASI